MAQQTEVADLTFDAFFASQYAGAVRLAVLLVDDVASAEDVAQDAFARLHAQWPLTVELPHRFLRRCILNAGTDVQRKRAVRRRHVERRLELPGPTVASYRELDDVLLRLPYRQRAAIVCRYHLDLTESEIADLLGVAPSTVRTLIRRGLTTLRKEIRS